MDPDEVKTIIVALYLIAMTSGKEKAYEVVAKWIAEMQKDDGYEDVELKNAALEFIRSLEDNQTLN